MHSQFPAAVLLLFDENHTSKESACMIIMSSPISTSEQQLSGESRGNTPTPTKGKDGTPSKGKEGWLRPVRTPSDIQMQDRIVPEQLVADMKINTLYKVRESVLAVLQCLTIGILHRW